MTDVLRALIPAMWLLWLAYWVMAGRDHKATLRQENPMSRLSHHGPLILGGVLLGVPNSAGPALEQPFHSITPAWLLAATVLVAIGLGFSALARLWLGRNWSAQVTVKQDHELIRSVTGPK
jgi:protein-S-isoprenylcysteine O-methyltransferase Ste14